MLVLIVLVIVTGVVMKMTTMSRVAILMMWFVMAVRLLFVWVAMLWLL